MNRPVAVPATVDYHCSDGQPMAESQFQLIPLVYAITVLCTYFQHRREIYVAGDMFLYYEKGNPCAVVAPDVFVVVGAPKHIRRSYKLWEEPKAPDFVLEVTSRSTREEDQGRKREIYASLSVWEYWLFDPTGDYLAPRLQGFHLHGGEYRPLPSVTMMGGGLSLHSEVLGLDVRLDAEGALRFHNPASGKDLPAHAEETAAHRVTKTRLDEEAANHQATKAELKKEAAARRAAETRIAELEARRGRVP